jgi:hypothetical protein
MLCNGYDKVLELSHGDLAELIDARGSTVRVTKGTIWMTQEQDTQDVVLRAGDVWTVERQGLTLLEAQGDALVCIVGAPVEVVRLHASDTPLSTRLLNWFESAWNSGRKEVPYY